MNYFLVLGVVLGVLARTTIPYWLKLSQGAVKFDWAYLRSAAISAVLGVVGGGLALPAIDPAMPPLAALWLGISSGYGMQSLARSVEKAVK